MKQLKCIIKSFILISLIISLASCDMLSGGKNKGKEKEVDKEKVGDTVQFLRFSPGNAEALGIVDKDSNGRSALARNAATNELILKILEDGSTKSFLTLPEGTEGEMAEISMILQSPDPETNCFFIVFKGESELTTPEKKYREYENEEGEIVIDTWEERKPLTIGQILCVFDDGSYNDILQQNKDGLLRFFDQGTPEDFFAFDKDGNLFYVLKEQDYSSTVTVIYKYDPSTSTSTRMTPKLSDIWYDKIQVSADAEWFFVQALLNGGRRYLRAIPVATPEKYIDLYYASENSASWLIDWVYDDDTECLYYSADGTINKIQKKDGTFSQDNAVPIFGLEANTKWYIDDKDNGIFDKDTETSSYTESYKWKEAYKDGESVDAAKVLAKLAAVCGQDEIDFKLTKFKDLIINKADYSGLYTDKTNEEAIKFLDTPENLLLIWNYLGANSDFDNGNGIFLNMTCFKKGTDESAYTLIDPNAPKIWWDGIKNFTPSYKKSLYGSDKEGFVEIVDEEGKNKGERITLKDSPKLRIISTVSADNGVYFLNSILNSNDKETGKHNICYYDVPENTLTNLFEKVTNGDNLEVISFSGGNNVLYFSALQGMTAINGKIDTKNGTYTELSSGDSFSKMIVVR